MQVLVLLIGLVALCSAEGQTSDTNAPVASNRTPKQETTKEAKPSTANESQAGKFHVRNLPADQLRDFRGLCFGSTTFRFYRLGDSWPLAPFCGMATCESNGIDLVEKVTECRMPKHNPKCKISNTNDRQKVFPDCCPKFECEEGAALEYPTEEEIEAQIQQNQEVQMMQAAMQQQQQLLLQQQQRMAGGGGLHPHAAPGGLAGLHHPGRLAGLQPQGGNTAALATFMQHQQLAGFQQHRQLQAAGGLPHLQHPGLGAPNPASLAALSQNAPQQQKVRRG